MEIFRVIITLVLIAIMIYGVSKKLNAPGLLMCLGLAVLLVITIITGESVLGDSTCGSKFLDLFELIKETFKSQFASSGIMMISIIGYVVYMDHIKASRLLALYASRALGFIKDPYMLAAGTLVVGCVLRLVFTSHSGLATLLFGTMYPVLLSLGVSKMTAASAVVLSGAFNWGPSDALSVWVCSQDYISSKSSIMPFFVHYQIPLTLIALAVLMVTFVIVNKKADKKLRTVHPELFEDMDSSKMQDPKELGLPAYYAVFPFLPLILVFIFSEMIVKTIILSVPAAAFLSVLFVLAIEMIRSKGKAVSAFNSIKVLWDGMGKNFANLVTLLMGASLFSKSLGIIGGTTILMEKMGASSFGLVALILAAVGINIIMAFAAGSSSAAVYTIVPSLPSAVDAMGADIFQVVAPILASSGMGRAIGFISPVVIVASSITGVDVVQLSKRNIIPAMCGLAAVVISSLVLF